MYAILRRRKVVHTIAFELRPGVFHTDCGKQGLTWASLGDLADATFDEKPEGPECKNCEKRLDAFLRETEPLEERDVRA